MGRVVHRNLANALSAEQLARAVREAIVPHLLHGRRWAAGHSPPLRTGGVFSQAHVEDFARLAMQQEIGLVHARLQALRADGVSVEDLYSALLAPAARFMGALWHQDQACFTEVTVGVGLLQQVMRETNRREGSFSHHAPARRILLVPSLGNTHVFGLLMVADLFSRAGWDVECDAGESAGGKLDAAAHEWYDVVGFSVADRSGLEALEGVTERLRRDSCNRRVGIMVGGSVFTEGPQVLGCPVADVVVTDACMAVDAATRLVLQGTAPP
jgi:methanogenic corrinoid protein MtbC1